MLEYVNTGGEVGGDIQMTLFYLYAFLAWGVGYSLWHREWAPAGVCAVCLACVYLWPIASIALVLAGICLLVLLVSYKG